MEKGNLSIKFKIRYINMTNIFEVSAENISALLPQDLAKLLDQLLHLEAKELGIPPASISVGSNITAPDGGEDGRIQWEGDPEPETGGYLPSRFVQFQVKSGKLGPTECANELVGSDGNLKSMIRQGLEGGSAYILFNSQKLTEQQIQRREASIQNKLVGLKLTNANNCIIKVYGSEKIAAWANQYLSAIVWVKSALNMPILHGLKTYDEWEETLPTTFEYVVDSKREDQTKEIGATLQNRGEVVRMIGTSGLGKTRMALEACRVLNEANQGVVYLDASRDIPNLAGIVGDWIRQDISGILIVDYCKIETHTKLSQEVKRSSSKLTLLTMHYTLDKGSDKNLIELSQMKDESIKDMLEQEYGDRLTDIDRIVSFAKGFPQMAVLLAEARLDQSEVQDMGSLTDDHLLKRMVWGDDDVDKEQRKILEACSLFNTFGFDGGVRNETELIARQVAKVSVDDFHKCIVEFTNKGLINRYGRLAQIVPIPLAIRLAADWWRGASREAKTRLIELDMPESLQEAFCDQIERLDFLPNVKEFTAKLCGRQNGPFGQAEVILSEKGSRYFRSLAVVNPEATSSALTNVFSQLKYGDFLGIGGETRRNLVTALERLCFHQETFLESVSNLYFLAKEENEGWSNNATGLFTQIYQARVPGTEANLDARLQYIDTLLDQDEFDDQLVVDALGKALDGSMGNMRWVGAENRGSGKPLQDYEPNDQELIGYWINCIERLTGLALSEYKNAKFMLADNIRSVVATHPSLLNAYDIAIRKIVDAQGPLWVEVSDRIWEVLEYNAGRMPEESVKIIENWVVLLQPESIEDRLELIVSRPGYHHERNDESELTDVSGNKAIELAKELANPLKLEEHHIQQLLLGEQRQAYIFGKTIYQETEEKESLLKMVLDALSDPGYDDAQMFYGMLCAIYEESPDQWEKAVSPLGQEPHIRLYVKAVTTGALNDKHLKHILDLRKEGTIEYTDNLLLSYGRVVDDLDASLISGFALELSRISQDDAWIALSIICSFCHGRPDTWDKVGNVTKEILLELDLDIGNASTRRGYNWEAASTRLVSDDPEFAKKLCERVLELVHSLGRDFRVLYIPRVLATVFEKHEKAVWPVFIDALESADERKIYHIKNLLDRDRIGLDAREQNLLNRLSENVLKDWCIKQPNIAPAMVGQVVELYEQGKDGIKFSDRVHYLLDNYGNKEEVLMAISANMGTFSSVGSLVGYYKEQKKALSTVAEHSEKKVQDWVRTRIEYLEEQIKNEQIYDEELFKR